ncbi:plasmid replication initiator TrfA [Desulfoplanes sp. PS50]
MYDIQDIVNSYEDIDDEAYEAFGNINMDYEEQKGGNRLPWWGDDKRAAPNGVLRSARFGVVPKGKRKYVENKSVCAIGKTTIFYTGQQLDQSDLDVWEQCLHFFRNRNLEKDIVFTKNQILKKIKKTGRGGKEYDWLKSSLARLTSGVVEIKNDKYMYLGHLVEEIFYDEKKKEYSMRLNPKMDCLFGNNDFSKIDPQKRHELNGQLAVWLFRFYSSHKKPFPMYVETIKDLCGSEDSLKSFKYNLKKAFEKISMITGWTCWIDKSGKVYVQKTKQIESPNASTTKKIDKFATDVSDFEFGNPSPF